MTPQSSLVIVRNPFDRRQRDERLVSLLGDVTVSKLISTHFPCHSALQVAIDGEMIAPGAWASRALRPGEQMVVMPAVHDGETLGVILTIAVIAFAPYAAGYTTIMTGGAFGGAGSFGLLALTAGYSILGSALIGALLAPSKPSLPGRQSSDVSQAYAWSQATTQTPGGAIHRAYGRNKLFGNIIAGYIESTGDTGFSQIAHLLVDLGQGPYSALSDFKLNNQPVGYYQGVTITARMGELDQSIIPAFNDTRQNQNIGSKVVAGSPVSRDTVGDDYNALEIVLVCPSGLWYANDAGGLDAVSVYTSVEISADGGSSWQFVEIEARSVITSYPGRWSLGRFIYKRVSRENISVWQEASAGSVIRTDHIDGDVSGIYRWRWLSGNVEVTSEVYDSITITGKSQQPIRRTLRIDNLDRGTRYKVRCTNLSADQTDTRYGDDLYLAEINEVMYDDFQYPRTVLAAVDALATDQISGSMNFSCLADCAIVRVWNGSAWVSQFSRNPAWICWDILTQPVLNNSHAVVRYDGLDPSRLDLSSFMNWADFCDTLVTDGHGGAEARCYFDGVFDTATSLWEAALEVCAIARAQLVMRGTKIFIVVDDARATPAQLFTVGNTNVNSFNETFLPMQDRAASIEVGYTNAAQDYARDTLTVVNAAISETAAQRIQIGLRGITRASQAWREAFYRLKRNELLKRTAILGVDIDALACTAGDLIWVQNDITRWGVGGRAASGSTTTRLQLDQSVSLESGIAYELKLRLADDTLVTRTITTTAGTVSAVDVSEAFPSAPSIYDVWALGETGKAIKEFLVLDVQRDGDQRAKLSLIEYNASLYGLDSGLPALETQDVSAAAPLPRITRFAVEEQMVLAAGGNIEVNLDIIFDTINTERVDVVEGGTLIGSSTSGTFTRERVVSGQAYALTLKPYSNLGVSPSSIWQYINHTVTGKLAPPQTVKGFTATRNGSDLYFSWHGNDELDVAGYEIRLGSSWDTAVAVGNTPRTALSIRSPQGGTYLIKAFDTVAPVPNYSTTAAQSIIAANSNINVVLTDDDATYGWGGTLTDMVIDGAALTLGYSNVLDDLPLSLDTYPSSLMSEGGIISSGSYITDPHDIGGVLNCNLFILPKIFILTLGQSLDSLVLPLINYSNNWTLEGPVGVVASLYEINTSIDGITWTGWQPFAAGLRTLRHYKLRASFVAQPGYQIKLDHFIVTIDVPDKVLRFANKIVPSGGLSLAFDPPLIAVNTIKVNLLNGLAGDRFTISNKTINGVDIDVYDDVLAAKAGMVDVEVFGY